MIQTKTLILDILIDSITFHMTSCDDSMPKCASHKYDHYLPTGTQNYSKK